MRIAMLMCVALFVLACGETVTPGDGGNSDSFEHATECDVSELSFEEMMEAGILTPVGYSETPMCGKNEVSLATRNCDEDDDPTNMYFVCDPPADDLDLDVERTVPCLWGLNARMEEGQCSYQSACIPEEHWVELEIGSWDDAVEERCD